MSVDNAQIRHRNFMATFQRFKDANPALPERGMLKLFAQRIGFSDRYLSHIKCNRKNIGSNVARTIESALGLPHGWMDREHNRVSDRVSDRGSDVLPDGASPADAHHDEAERMFLETAKTLYRADPEGTHRALMELLRKRLLGTIA